MMMIGEGIGNFPDLEWRVRIGEVERKVGQEAPGSWRS